MMKIAVQAAGPSTFYDLDTCYRIIAESGFDGVDCNVDHLYKGGLIRTKERVPAFDASGAELLSYFKPWKDAAEKYGLDNYQAHAPFPSSIVDGGEHNDYMIEVLKKTIIGCDYIGCRNLIVHPFYYAYDNQMTPQDEWDINIESYSKLIPTAKEYGVTVCLENMFTVHHNKVIAAVCSDITTACNYIDTLNDIAGSKCFGFCLDTGHLLLIGKDIKNAMVQLGDRISAFHVHDNDGWDDLHLAPYMGRLDWDRFVEGLKAIHFDKTLSFETFNVWHKFDKEVCPAVMKLIAETGRMFARRAAE